MSPTPHEQLQALLTARADKIREAHPDWSQSRVAAELLMTHTEQEDDLIMQGAGEAFRGMIRDAGKTGISAMLTRNHP